MDSVDGIVARLHDRVRAGGLLPAGEPVVVLLSGGRDSVCLVDVAAALAGPGVVTALHVNYGLRDDADGDERACAGLCAMLEVPLEVQRAQRPQDAGNLQAWARDQRYAAGARLAATTSARLAAAHTQTDQVETILYRLAASPGRRALLGMEARNGRLVRPLLGTTREETGAYCEARGLRYCEDPTNETGLYARGRVRHGLVAALREIHPAAERNVLRTAELLRDEAAVLDTVVETALDGRNEIAISHLGALPPALARLVVRRLAEDAAGGLCARAPRRLAELLALGDGALDLGDGVRAVVEAGVLRMTQTPEPPHRTAGG